MGLEALALLSSCIVLTGELCPYKLTTTRTRAPEEAGVCGALENSDQEVLCMGWFFHTPTRPQQVYPAAREVPRANPHALRCRI